jgi:site-specific recombinase XerD
MMSIDKCPLSPVLVRFQDDLQLNRCGERTQQSYVRNLRKFAEFLQRDPDSASEDDLRNYLLFIKNERHWSASTINVAQQAIKKFFTLTCPKDWHTLKLVRARGEFKIPVVISIGEVHTLLKLIDKPSMSCWDSGSKKLFIFKSPILTPTACWYTSIVARELRIE